MKKFSFNKNTTSILSLIAIVIILLIGGRYDYEIHADEEMQRQLILQQDSLHQDSVSKAYSQKMEILYSQLSNKQVDEITRQLELLDINRINDDGNSEFSYIEIAEEYATSWEYYDNFK